MRSMLGDDGNLLPSATENSALDGLEGGNIAAANAETSPLTNGWQIPGTTLVVPWLAIGATIAFVVIAYQWTHGREKYAR